MKLQDQTILITGASRGIGRAIALEFAQHPVNRLILVARSADQLQTLADEIEAQGVAALPLVLDLQDAEAVQVAISQTWRDVGPIQILINCAGVAHQTPFLRSQLPNVETELSVNLLGTYTVTHCLAKRMAVYGDGVIVNVASLMGRVAAPTMATYSATKFALLGFTQALRQELKPYNIKVVALLPSLTDTGMVRDLAQFRGVVSAPPKTVAQALVRGLQRDTSEIVVGWQARMALFLNRWLPQVMNWVMAIATPPLPSIAKPTR
jgi:3-oxoacyl-[acyl-carrier protein] reductase